MRKQAPATGYFRCVWRLNVEFMMSSLEPDIEIFHEDEIANKIKRLARDTCLLGMVSLRALDV